MSGEKGARVLGPRKRSGSSTSVGRRLLNQKGEGLYVSSTRVGRLSWRETRVRVPVPVTVSFPLRSVPAPERVDPKQTVPRSPKSVSRRTLPPTGGAPPPSVVVDLGRIRRRGRVPCQVDGPVCRRGLSWTCLGR